MLGTVCAACRPGGSCLPDACTGSARPYSTSSWSTLAPRDRLRTRRSAVPASDRDQGHHRARDRRQPGTGGKLSRDELQVPDTTLFLRALPASACVYRGVGVTAPQRATNGGANGSMLCMTGTFTHSCEPGQLLQTPSRARGRRRRRSRHRPACRHTRAPSTTPAAARSDAPAARPAIRSAARATTVPAATSPTSEPS